MNGKGKMKRVSGLLSAKQMLLGAVVLSMATIGLAQVPATAPATPRPPAKQGLTLTPAVPVSPELAWTHVPDGTVSFAIILHDPDTSLTHTTDEVIHWLIFNIPGTATGLPEGVPNVAQLPDGSVQAMNRGRKPGYMGMGMGAAGPYHHYTWELFALDTKLTLGADATRADLMAAMNGHILDKGVLVGRYHHP